MSKYFDITDDFLLLDKKLSDGESIFFAKDLSRRFKKLYVKIYVIRNSIRK